MTATAKLQGGNTKLGVGIHSWSIPAITTCPGSSSLCRSSCYAASGFFHMPNVKAFHEANYAFSRTPEFAGWMIGEVQKNLAKVVRVHVAGDFYDAEYVAKWVQIAKACRSTTFFVYTRSWSEIDVYPHLVALSRLVNVCLWFSTDREKGPPPRVPGVRIAYMAVNDIDAACAPDDSDLVFRDSPQTPMKRANGVLVCPAENAVPGRLKHTCTSCGICWDKQRKPYWEQQLLPLFGDLDEGIPFTAPS